METTLELTPAEKRIVALMQENRRLRDALEFLIDNSGKLTPYSSGKTLLLMCREEALKALQMKDPEDE